MESFLEPLKPSMKALLILLAILFSLVVFADPPTPTIPDTPAGHTLSLWLDAFNSGDSVRIESFIKERASWVGLDWSMRLRARTGGYDLLAIESSQQIDVIFLVREKASASELIGRIKVNENEPPVVTELGLFPVETGARFEAVRLDASARTRVIDSAVRILNESYVFPDTAKKVTAAVRSRERRGDYNAIGDGEEFARALTNDLRNSSQDKHLEVRFSFVVQSSDESRTHSQDQTLPRKQLAASNCGFEKAEHLPPNIGYLKLNLFADPEICAPTAIAALNFLADSDALILDLRDNNGGRSGMVTLIASYLFDAPTHLNDAYNRKANATEQFWTLPYVPGRKFIGKPVILLTSKTTFSAAEDFSYALKNLKRATLIGETTGGGAHPVEPHRIDDHFSIVVPFARSISPITKTDWEGTGVEPDVRVEAADALTEALRLARNVH
jgi:hypothetical protein